ncbi:MAG: type IV toxin-antitoxin system AbiEi family antitoxin domain-containing protein [Nocardioidaceae bacterium]|nr:type IV toxin-antitoxin system AbiEi family antitoxin domain-containing protein [Nocardioidaceae bacterium]
MTIATNLPDRPFTTQQATLLGVSEKRLAELTRAREIRRVLRGVYVPTGIPDNVKTRATAAALVISPFAVLCDRSAAWLHGVDTFAYQELEILPPLETFVLRGLSRIRRDGVAGGRRDLAARDIVDVHGVRTTTPLRTALDLGCKLRRRDALAALDGFMRLHGLTHEVLRAELPRYFRRRGVIQLRSLIPVADPSSESPGESWTRMAIIDAGLPIPELQFEIVVDGRIIYRLDLAYPRHKVCVEYDGREFHESLARRAADERRRDWLRRHGWHVIVITKADFDSDSIQAWTSEIRLALF